MDEVLPPLTRALMALEMTAELAHERPLSMTQTIFRPIGGRELSLSGSSNIAGLLAVARGELSLAMINPSAILTLAHRGNTPFDAPQPLRTIAVIPSRDEFACAINPRSGVRTFSDLTAKKAPLRIVVRGERRHAMHALIDDLLRVHGISRSDIVSWGGEFVDGEIRNPTPDAPSFRAFIDGTYDALWDEGVDAWLPTALEAGMTVLPIAEPELRALEALGYRRATAAGVPTLDFSGWPLYVHADLPDEEVTRICNALADCVERIPWQEDAPLTLARMVKNAPDAPYDVPLHPAAERAWKERGLL